MSPEAGSDLHCGWVASLFTFKPGHINNSSNLLQSGKPEHHERQTGRQEADCTECLVMQLCTWSCVCWDLEKSWTGCLSGKNCWSGGVKGKDLGTAPCRSLSV